MGQASGPGDRLQIPVQVSRDKVEDPALCGGGLPGGCSQVFQRTSGVPSAGGGGLGRHAARIAVERFARRTVLLAPPSPVLANRLCHWRSPEPGVASDTVGVNRPGQLKRLGARMSHGRRQGHPQGHRALGGRLLTALDRARLHDRHLGPSGG